ncbi:MAG: 50S ribosomal protein L17 [Deltaproteobacteria bacterium]|nr:50S ribosomal protein L17 [Deltaproteobacteria bacterium]
MHHRKTHRKLARSPSHRRALFANMANALIEHGRIQTTDSKAKELKRYAEKLVTLGKKGTLAARRQALAVLRSEAAVAELFGSIAPRFMSRPGGYTRVLKIGHRHGDNAPVSMIEFVDRGEDVADASSSDSAE